MNELPEDAEQPWFFTLWRDAEGDITLWHGDGPPVTVDGKPLAEGDTRIAGFRAWTWEEAIRKRDDILGWPRRKPSPPADPGTRISCIKAISPHD
jgi:hypothetical protein